jgi:hypothetical protein
MREFLEKNYKETSGQGTVKLAIRALLEVSFFLFMLVPIVECMCYKLPKDAYCSLELNMHSS